VKFLSLGGRVYTLFVDFILLYLILLPLCKFLHASFFPCMIFSPSFSSCPPPERQIDCIIYCFFLNGELGSARILEEIVKNWINAVPEIED